MAISFNIPKSPTKQVYTATEFLGADFTSEASTVDDTKSPNVENMIRSVPGKIRKRMGYSLFADYGACIYGVHHLSTTDTWLIHAGDKLYNLTAPKGSYWVDHVPNYIVDHDENNILLNTGNVDITLIYTGMAEHKSVSFQLNQKLVILDGSKLRIYDGSTVQPIENVAYIPTLTIAKDYTGGGTDYEPLNLLQPAFIEQFLVKSDQASVREFQLTFGDLDSTPVKAWVLNSSGEWVLKTENTDFSVNRTAGKITFTTAPGASPITGEDNVKIQAYRTVAGYADRVNHCTIGAMFGVNGAGDRLFISGNPDQGVDSQGNLFTYINCDWFSQQYDPTYFADVWYSKLGSDTSAIMGYSIINNYLAAHKDFNELTQSILIREGDLVDDEPVFKLINTLQGAGAISKYCFSYLATEPVFLTRLGVYAVTAQDITGEKYAQDRSYYLEGKLLKEEGLENAIAYTWKDYYILAVNSHLYILDGLQPIHTDRSRPYATRQYVGFYFTNVPATVFFEINNELYFGTADGKVYKWATDEKALDSYNDDGEPITALWETADISEKLFYKKKTYRYVALRCMPEISSSVQIWAQKEGQWTELKDDITTLKYFSYENLQYSKLTYSCNRTQKVSATKIRLKKLDHVRFKFINDLLNEPLGINDFAVEYTQAGNVK
jgi:hypothetical protein